MTSNFAWKNLYRNLQILEMERKSRDGSGGARTEEEEQNQSTFTVAMVTIATKVFPWLPWLSKFDPIVPL